MTALILFIYWVMTPSHEGTDSWVKLASALIIPVLIVGVVVLGAVLAWAWKGVQFSEGVWLKLAERWAQTENFSKYVAQSRRVREMEFIDMIEKMIEAAILEHNNEPGSHRVGFDHQLRNKIQEIVNEIERTHRDRDGRTKR